MRDAFRLGEWIVHPRLNQISRGGRVAHLRARVMELLVFFAEHPGEVLSKDEILEHVWGAKFVAESSLTTALTEIRQAFEDDARHPWLIETIAKRGYRLIPAPDTLTAPTVERAHRTVGARLARWALATSIPCIVVVGVVMAVKQRHAAPATHRTVIVLPL